MPARYMYPGGADKTDYAEVFARLSGTVGPATLLAGLAYASKQQALGKCYSPLDDPTEPFGCGARGDVVLPDTGVLA